MTVDLPTTEASPLTVRISDASPDSVYSIRGADPTGGLPMNTFVVDVVGATTVRLGPDEWLRLGPTPADGWPRSPRVGGKAFDITAVDVSGQYVVLRVDGRQATDLLARGCSIDLHRNSFRVGSAARTLLAQAVVVLLCDANDVARQSVRLVVRSSFASYARAWLADASVDLDDGRQVPTALR